MAGRTNSRTPRVRAVCHHLRAVIDSGAVPRLRALGERTEGAGVSVEADPEYQELAPIVRRVERIIDLASRFGTAEWSAALEDTTFRSFVRNVAEITPANESVTGVAILLPEDPAQPALVLDPEPIAVEQPVRLVSAFARSRQN